MLHVVQPDFVDDNPFAYLGEVECGDPIPQVIGVAFDSGTSGLPEHHLFQ